jgi:hypothetical protein
MKNIILFGILFIISFSINDQVNTRNTYVNGYYKSNGTYIEGHY